MTRSICHIHGCLMEYGPCGAWCYQCDKEAAEKFRPKPEVYSAEWVEKATENYVEEEEMPCSI